MKIGIIGAPGSGKSELARKLAGAIERKKYLGKVKVIDGYVDKLSRQTGFTYGYYATYEQNLQILFDRWTLEQIAAHRGQHTLTCGTIYETICYAAIHANQAAVRNDDQEEFLKGRTAMTAFGMIEADIFDYDALFYLPYDGKVLMEKGRSYDTVIDRKVPEVLQGHFKQALTLSGTVRENVKYATEVVRAIQDHAEAAEDDQSGVRGSRDVDTEESAGE